MNDSPIGVFDSGIGGLTVARELHRRLPGEEIIYLGDTARVPYGTKSTETVRRYAMECALYLLSKNVKMIVIACNTASAVALDQLKRTLRAPIIGVVDPGVSTALKATKDHRIGVIGTPSTINSQAYKSRLMSLAPKSQVWGHACPLLVPLAEEGRFEGEVVDLILREYLQPLLRHRIDTLILGCTHYPLFKPAIQRIVGGRIRLVDSAEAAATEVEAVILREGLLNTHGAGKVTCCVTDIPRQVNRLGKLFFGDSLGKVLKVAISE